MSIPARSCCYASHTHMQSLHWHAHLFLLPILIGIDQIGRPRAYAMGGAATGNTQGCAGTLASNHCNLTRVDVGRAGRPAAAARVPSPAAGAYNSDSYDMDEDDMGGDPGGYGGPHGFGMFGRLYGDSYDSEEDPYGDRYGYGYDRYEDVCMGYHYAPGPPRKVNPWSFDNPESRQYWFKDAKGTVGKRVTAVPDPKDVLAAPKMTQYPINQAKLDELGLRIGSLSFPVKVSYRIGLCRIHLCAKRTR